MTVAIPKDFRIYSPSAQNDNISKVAKYQKYKSDFDFYKSKLSLRKENKSLFLPLSEGDVVSSVKNFIIRDPETNQTVLKVFKFAADSHTVKVAHPFNAEIGFIIAIAAIAGTP
jgi:hypothetical protein